MATREGRFFSDDPDRKQWLQTPAEACEKTGWRIHAYIHLNPARAKLIGIGRERLGKYVWSSYSLHLAAQGRRPGWLVTRRVMGNLGLTAQNAEGYEASVEGRVLELGRRAGREELNGSGGKSGGDGRGIRGEAGGANRPGKPSR